MDKNWERRTSKMLQRKEKRSTKSMPAEERKVARRNDERTGRQL